MIYAKFNLCSEFCEYQIPIFGVCAGERCPSWELNPEPLVLLVSNGLSQTHQVATPSDTQHTKFALF